MGKKKRRIRYGEEMRNGKKKMEEKCLELQRKKEKEIVREKMEEEEHRNKSRSKRERKRKNKKWKRKRLEMKRRTEGSRKTKWMKTIRCKREKIYEGKKERNIT